MNERSLLNYVVVYALMALFITAWYHTAWTSEDIHFTFRQVIHFMHGEGIVWNRGERAQAFSHPSWFFLISAAYALTGELFRTTLAISFICSAACFYFLLSYGSASVVGWILVGSMLFSQAFMDYTSSGLENPLSYLFITLIFLRFYRNQYDATLWMLMGLAFLTRMDHVFIIAPLAAYAFVKAHYRLTPLIPAALLCASWILFSWFYFGSPFPTTYFAKMDTGIPAAEYHQKFLHYIRFTALNDPLTLWTMVVALIAGLWRGDWPIRFVCFGIIIHFFYLASIGGDYMGGRFFTLPYILSVLVLITVSSQYYERLQAGVLAVSIALMLFPGDSRFSIRTDLSIKRDQNNVINDRRAEYNQGRHLIEKNIPWPKTDYLKAEKPFNPISMDLSGAKPMVHNNEYFYNSYGIGDPYIGRLPAIQKKNWVIGHQHRHIPTDFELWIKGVIPALPDPVISEYFNDVRTVSRAPLFSKERLEALLRITSIKYRTLDLSAYKSTEPPALYSEPMLPHIAQASMAQHRKVDWSEIPNLSPKSDYEKGLVLQGPVALKISGNNAPLCVSGLFDNNDYYLLTVMQRKAPPMHRLLGTNISYGLTERSAHFDKPVSDDAILIIAPLAGDNKYAVASLKAGSCNQQPQLGHPKGLNRL